MKAELSKILSVAWLKKNGYLLELPNRSFVVQRIRVVRRIDVQINPKLEKMTRARKCVEVLHGIKDRMIYEYAKKEYIPGDLINGRELERYHKRFNDIPSELFTMYVVDRKTKKKIFTITTCIDEIESIHIWDPKVEGGGAELSLNNIINERQAIIEQEQPAVTLTPDKFLTVEDQAIRICERFATGMYTIVEACEYYQVPYAEYVEWLAQSDHLKNIHDQAVRLSTIMNTSRQVNLLDNIIIQILTRGYTTEEVTEYDIITLPNGEKHREPVRVKVSKKDLKAHELTHLKNVLTNPNRVMLPGEGTSDFSNMTDEELTNYINSKSNGTAKPNEPEQ